MAKLNDEGLIKLEESEKQALRNASAQIRDLKKLINQARLANLDKAIDLDGYEERMKQREKEIKGVMQVYGDETI